MNKKKRKNKLKKLPNTAGSKVRKKNEKIVKSKSLIIAMSICFTIFILLLIRLAFLQFIQGSELKEAANRQQSTNRIISAKRGNIYDATGKLLASSASVDTVSINPSRIDKEDKEKVAKAFSTIFELDYNEVLEKRISTNLKELV